MLQENIMKILAILILAVILANCTSSDIEDLPPLSSSSNDGVANISSSSSSTPVLADVNCMVNGVCAELSQSACNSFSGTPVPSCPSSSSSYALTSGSSSSNIVLPSSSSSSLTSVSSSSSNIVSPSSSSSSSTLKPSSSSSSNIASSSSSSSLMESNVSCFVGANCAETSQSACTALGGTPVPSCPVSSSSSSLAVECPSYSSDIHFCDSRDGKVYKWIKIDSQTWMAENLNYNASSSVCYSNSDARCITYGRLYNWETAKTACPIGWHLSTHEEWEILSRFVGGEDIAGKHLKAKEGWNSNSGLDTYGFAALPGGSSSEGIFNDVGNSGYWWTASEYKNYAYQWYMRSNIDGAKWVDAGRSVLKSVRCIQD